MKAFAPVKILSRLILAAALFAASASAAHARSSGADDFRMDLSITQGETSKDSHEAVFSCVISGRSAVYSGPFGKCVRGQCEHKKIHFNLTAKEREELAALAGELSLYSSFSEVRTADDIGTWVQASLAISQGERKGTIRVVGMVNNWGRRTAPSAPEISTRAREQMRKLEMLRRAVTAMARKRFSEFH